MSQLSLPSRWLITSPQFANDPDIFPLLPGFSFITSKKPTWSTGIAEASSGRQRARQIWSYPKWQFKVGYEVLRDSPTYQEQQKLLAFFNAHAGRYQQFFFYDPSDNTATNTQFGVGNGSLTTFQLYRTVADPAFTTLNWSEPVRGIVGTPTVRVNGVMVGAPIGKNLCLWSQDFTNAAWLSNAGSTRTANTNVAPDGTTTADTLADTSTSAAPAAAYQNVTIPNDGSTYTFSCYFKKTTTATAAVAFACVLAGGANLSGNLFLNTNTGQTHVDFVPASSTSVVDAGNYWRVSVTITNNSSGNNVAQLAIYPTYGPNSSLGGSDPTLTGSCVAWGAQIEAGSSVTAYVPTTSSGGDYTIGPLGQITFNSAPTGPLTWSGNFMFLCRFDDDTLDTAQMMNGLWSADGIGFTSVKA